MYVKIFAPLVGGFFCWADGGRVRGEGVGMWSEAEG